MSGLLLAALAYAASPNLVVVTLDTTRADALSCYGVVPGLLAPPAQPVTPFLDAEAAAGIRFERFYAHAPTTLSSHASLFTGLDPHGHGLPRNGFPLAAGTRTLAGRLREAGWDTLAVVSAKALEASMGLNQGFRVYDDHTPHLRTLMHQDTAGSVVDRAIQAVDGRDAEKPLFLWVHFYDPHAPYEAPEPYRHRFTVPGYTGPFADEMQARLAPLREGLRQGSAPAADVAQVNGLYLGEVAYMDAEIERLMAGLRARGLLDEALVVYVADHGETLNERPADAWTHGGDVH
jgi:arylsulfatase A-like enzyme